MKVFIVHYKRLTERKKRMIEQLDKYNLEAEFVEQYDRNTLLDSDKKLFKNCDFANIAITLSHLYCFDQIKNNYDYALILEDDCIFSDNFTDICTNYLKQLPTDWDMLFIGNGCNFHIKNNELVENVNVYLYNSTRCTDSYFVSKKCAAKILDDISQPGYIIKNPVDHWLNIVFQNNKFKIYWAEPTIATQGTQNGLYRSSH